MEFARICNYFPSVVAEELRLIEARPEELREIRIRAGCPPVALLDTLTLLGDVPFSLDMVQRTAERMCQNSLYARQQELRRGYVTLPGGHRAGFCGRTVIEKDTVQHLTDISSINLRIAHQIIGAADKVMPAVVQNGDILNTLIISPPGCGKTTLLRDMARQLGGGTYRFRVGLCDERGEIAAMYRGMAQNDVGFLTDVYDGCPKAEAMRSLVRSMSPQVLMTDELGGKEDEEAICEAIHAGVRVICTVHGYNREDAASRVGIGTLIRSGVFRRTIVLGGIGNILSM